MIIFNKKTNSYSFSYVLALPRFYLNGNMVNIDLATTFFYEASPYIWDLSIRILGFGFIIKLREVI